MLRVQLREEPSCGKSGKKVPITNVVTGCDNYDIDSHIVSCMVIFQGRISGTLQCYSLPKLALESKHIVSCRPHRIALNSNSAYVTIPLLQGLTPSPMYMYCPDLREGEVTCNCTHEIFPMTCAHIHTHRKLSIIDMNGVLSLYDLVRPFLVVVWWCVE